MDSEKTISVKKIVTNPPGSHIAREERACGARARQAEIHPALAGGRGTGFEKSVPVFPAECRFHGPER